VKSGIKIKIHKKKEELPEKTDIPTPDFYHPLSGANVPNI